MVSITGSRRDLGMRERKRGAREGGMGYALLQTRCLPAAAVEGIISTNTIKSSSKLTPVNKHYCVENQ